MFKPVDAKGVNEYLAKVPEERQELVNTLHEFIQKTAPKLKVHFAYNMVGYGSFDYKNYKGEQIQWPVVALANQKQYVSVYVCGLHNGNYVAEEFKDDLGKVSVGKSCIRIKKLDDVNMKTLAKVIKIAEATPGLEVSAK